VDGGQPQHPEDCDPAGPRARPAAWCTAAGVILGTAAVICLALGAVTVQQAIALTLPAALLIIGGLVWAAAPDAATAGRLGFQAGFQLGALLGRLRSVLRQRGNGS
jgi:hypothetical protein